MLVYRNTEYLPRFRNAVLTIGTFDGVHTGHQQVIAKMKKRALEVEGETVIVTFEPHPRTIVRAADDLRLINTLDEKIELLADKGIDHLVIVPFTAEFAQLSAEDYIRQFLVRYFHPHTLIIGYDHRFGKGRSGNYELLEQQSALYQFHLMEIPPHLLNSISVSSTRIREAIAAGDMDSAEKLLGYRFFFSGQVIQGDQIGRKIGYPTANLTMADQSKMIPGDGVYAVDVVVSDEPACKYRGMMNIGYRPTVAGTQKMVEVNIFDFDRTIYHCTLKVYVKKFLRAEEKFSGLEALKSQLGRDRALAERIV